MSLDILGSVNEQSTYGVRVSIVDEDGNPVTPTTCTWTLSDETGAVVNSRDAVSVSPPAANFTVALIGDDLAMVGAGQKELRYFTVSGTYNSDTLGPGIPFHEEIGFYVKNLVGV